MLWSFDKASHFKPTASSDMVKTTTDSSFMPPASGSSRGPSGASKTGADTCFQCKRSAPAQRAIRARESDAAKRVDSTLIRKGPVSSGSTLSVSMCAAAAASNPIFRVTSIQFRRETKGGRSPTAASRRTRRRTKCGRRHAAPGPGGQFHDLSRSRKIDHQQIP